MKKKVEVIIQARMGSTRLPGKVMLNLCGKPVLWHVLQRVKQAKKVDDIIVATSNLQADDIIADYLNSIDTKCFRGDESDVLSRYYYATKKYPADAIIRITADCPLIDPNVIDDVVSCFFTHSCKYASNFSQKRSFPRGLDCEIFSFQLLERAFHEATEDFEREHVTPFMYWKQHKIATIENKEDYSDMRWTLDTLEDFELIQAIYHQFYHGEHNFYMKEIYSFLKSNPQIMLLNQEIQQKPVK
ncbi:glycosyltransferase family protein [Paludicola sp. MB14-C6]|uniref:glycosyltransferase family protein n=1 Tax=Paludihabitans sp. MB14-C6 TaxID=3070656 RepID=UPI0027DBF8E2|nr:glycosyltransferase family protein [Paludicola sp. MB14-C6]WMJ24045.1 glycosyltransferase family protein [Paludicola sp. MB14-C6]